MKMTLRSSTSYTEQQDSDVARKYLTWFKVKHPSDYSPLFRPEHERYWDAFHDHYTPISANASRDHVYKVLEFLRYMKELKVNPFIRSPKDPITCRSLDLIAAYKGLQSELLENAAVPMNEDLRRLRFRQSMKLLGSHYFLSDKGSIHQLQHAMAFAPKSSRTLLDPIISELHGTLYFHKIVPPELSERYNNAQKSVLHNYTDLVHDLRDTGWYKVKHKGPYDLEARRARDGVLVLRFRHVLPKEISFGTRAATTNYVRDLWKRTQPTL